MREIKSKEPTVFSQTVHVLGKEVPVFIRGSGSIPLLVLGQASLFKKHGFIPADLDPYFSIYFVDIFEKSKSTLSDFNDLQLYDFLDAIEKVRTQLKLDKIALFSHSAAGVLAIEYGKRYKKNVLLSILMATAPIWGTYKNQLSADYFQYNATTDRHLLLKQDQEELAELKEKKEFTHLYMARRALFFSNPLDLFWQSLWHGVIPDRELIDRYFELIKDYDIRETPPDDIFTLLLLGLRDYSAPFYDWTDKVGSTDHRFFPLDPVGKEMKTTPKKVYYIFDAAHYPCIEDPTFPQKVIQFISERFPHLMPYKSKIGESSVVDLDSPLPTTTTFRSRL